MENDSFEYRIIVGDMQKKTASRTCDLLNLVRKDNIDSLVFLDRSARPASWLFEAFWCERFQDDLPAVFYLNLGKKDLRSKYMPGQGIAIKKDGGFQFTGETDDPENIELFKKRVSDDYATKEKVRLHFGQAGEKAMSGKNVLVVDDIEFEGVQKLFTIAALSSIYKPKDIGYFEWSDYGLRLSHGLSYKDDGGFASYEDEAYRELVERTKHEIAQLAKDYAKRI